VTACSWEINPAFCTSFVGERCDLSEPVDDWVSGSPTNPPSAFTLFTGQIPRYPSAANPAFLTPLAPLRPATVLRWGSTEDVGPPDLWDGFGYRHIAAKHGRSPADDAATRDVLMTMTPFPRADRGADRWVFEGTPYAGRDGRPCVRVVVVDYGVAEGNSEAEGIITSYGEGR
jgi:hypothetical protein